MTPFDFSKHENNRVALAAILANPLLQVALDALMGELQPGVVNDGVVSPVVAASRYQQIAGANHIVKGLDRLTRPPKEQVRPSLKQLLPEPPLPNL